MEKKIWTRPMAEVETFMANEYIAKCEDTVNEYYKFVCNAGGGVYGGAWQESNNVAGLQSSDSGYWWQSSYVPADEAFTTSRFHACNIEHYAPKSSTVFLHNCYYKPTGAKDSEAIPVIIWRGNEGTNVHCTTFLDNQFEVVKGNKS